MGGADCVEPGGLDFPFVIREFKLEGQRTLAERPVDLFPVLVSLSHWERVGERA